LVWFALALRLIQSGWATPLVIQGPGISPSDFKVTVFASGLDFPLAMAELDDGSILAALNTGTSFYNSVGRLVRLVDADGDGVAESPPQILADGLPGKQSALKIAGKLVLVTGAGQPMTILRHGATVDVPLIPVGRIDFKYPGSDYHAHSTLEVRPTPGVTNSHDVVFQLGSNENAVASTRTVEISSSTVPGASGTLIGDSAYMMTLTDHGTHVEASDLKRIAGGLRNAAGFAFHPATGDLYLQDNGIDGLVNANEPHSVDELNRIPRGWIGTLVPDFGFPDNYTAYRTAEVVGGLGEQPLITFQPIPNPLTGRRSEGPNQMAFAPSRFPAPLNRGIFIGFHGRFSLGGIQNDENPVVYADPGTGEYFHFIAGQQPGVGHLDGLLATRDSLFVADLVTHGNLFNGGGAGVIYRIESLVAEEAPTLTLKRGGSGLFLEWSQRLRIFEAEDPAGPWAEMKDIFSPHPVPSTAPRRFFRAEE